MTLLVRGIITLSMAFAFSATASAQMLSNPSQVSAASQTSVGGGFTSSKIEYKGKDDDQEIKRTILSGELGYGLTKKATVFGHVGMITKSEAEADNGVKVEEGKGNIFGGGLRFAAVNDGKKNLVFFGLINMMKEEYDDNNVKFQGNTYEVNSEVEMTDIIAGGTYGFMTSPGITPYGGIQFVFSSDGDLESKNKLKGQNGAPDQTLDKVKEDIERDDSMAIKVGCNVLFEGVNIRPEATFAGEQNYSLSGAYTF
jgi:hypothetical protein